MNQDGYAQNITSESARKAGHQFRTFSVEEIAQIVDRPRRSILRRAERENWHYETASVRGGYQKLFALKDLPPDITKTIRIHFGEIPEELAGCVPADLDQAKMAECSQSWDAAQPWQRQVARDRQEILEMLDRFQASHGTKRKALDRFVALFRSHEVPGLEPAIYQRVKRISRAQLYAWRIAFESEGIAGLICKYGSNRGTMKVPAEQREFIRAVWTDKPHLGPARIAETLMARFNGDAASTRQVAKFLRLERQNDPQTCAFIESPDNWRSRYMLSLGKKEATHFLHWVEVDSTPADVMCNDNRRYAVLGLIDVFSRKCKFIVCPTSNSWGIAALLYATCLDWGIPENLMRDNGQDYASRTTNVGLANLGVHVRAARPFNPREKPHIERVFGTLTRNLFEVLPGYVGHNVADRKKIEDRKSFAARMNGKPCIQLGLTASALQERIDGWTEQVYHQREHSSLGVSPNAKAASVPRRPRRIEDPRALDILLARPAGKKDEPTRIVRDIGVQFENGRYWGDCLIDWIGKPVMIRLDLRDAGRLFCFDPDTRDFIGDVRDMALSGMSVGDKIAAQKRAAKVVRERVKAWKLTARTVGDPFAEEFEQAKRAAKLRNLPVGEPIRDNPFLDAAMQAADLVRQEEAQQPEPVRVGPRPTAQVIFPEQDEQDPKVAIFKNKLPTCKQEIVFKNDRVRFDYLRGKQQFEGPLTDAEIRWVLTVLNTAPIQRHIAMFSQDWDECDRLWLGSIAPTQYPQFVESQTKGEIR